MPKVYIVNRSHHDLSQAARFGELKFLSEGPISRFGTNQILRTFEPTLINSTPDDSLLVTGLTIMNVLAGVYLYNMHGKLNMLLFAPQKGDYLQRSVIIPEITQTIREGK